MKAVMCMDLQTLKATVRDEARISKDISLERNIDAVTAYRMSTKQLIPIVDVRTTQEYQLDGHVPDSFNIPAFVRGKWNEYTRAFNLDENPNFVKEFAERLPDREGTVIIMCRSGHRSVLAITLLVQAGYLNLYNMWEGFTGLVLRDKDLQSGGKINMDGWRVRGLP